jgi:DnaK suppressor protein
MEQLNRSRSQERRVTMNKAQLKKFRSLLEEKRDEILKKAKQTLDEDMTLDADDLPDEMDLASSEYLQSFTFRLRGREKTFLDKINKALVKIDDGSFGVCEECEEEISLKRLEARPETTLCIRCKEDQERMEKDYGLGPDPAQGSGEGRAGPGPARRFSGVARGVRPTQPWLVWGASGAACASRPW